MLIPLMAADTFGVNSLARAMAIILPVNTIGQTWFPYFVSILREHFGTYTIALGTVLAVAIVVVAPLGLLVYQSFLDAPFFNPRAQLSLAAYQYVIADPDFHSALGTSLIVSTAMVVIAVPIGSLLAFLLVRADLPWRRLLEPGE